jgi:hypothetical protein
MTRLPRIVAQSPPAIVYFLFKKPGIVAKGMQSPFAGTSMHPMPGYFIGA